MQQKSSSLGWIVLRILLSTFVSATLLKAQGISPPAQEKAPEIEALASQLANQLTKSGKKSVLIVDFKGPTEEWLPFGAWLADEFTSSLTSMRDQFEVIDRARLTAALNEQHLSSKDELDVKMARRLGRSLGAETLIRGSFGAAENGIGVTLGASDVKGSESKPWIGVVYGKIPLTEAVAARLNVPIESLRPKDGIFQAGEGGVSSPRCLRCPNPSFSAESIKEKLEGSVLLNVVITPEGRVTQITVEKALGAGLTDQAMQAVRNWRLEPAIDPDGKPVPVHMKIGVAFHRY